MKKRSRTARVRTGFLGGASTSAGCFAAFAFVLKNPNLTRSHYFSYTVQNVGYHKIIKMVTFFLPVV